MKKNIVKYGLYGEDEKALVPDFVHCETIETRSRAHDWEIKPHIHLNLLQIFLFEKGEGVIIGEKQDTVLQTPCIVVMPANNLHGFRYTTETNGRVITLSDSFLESLFKTSPKVNLELNQMRHIPIDNETARFESLIRTIDRISEELYEDFQEKRLALHNKGFAIAGYHPSIVTSRYHVPAIANPPNVISKPKRRQCNHRADTKTTSLLTSKLTFGRQKLG